MASHAPDMAFIEEGQVIRRYLAWRSVSKGKKDKQNGFFSIGLPWLAS